MTNEFIIQKFQISDQARQSGIDLSSQIQTENDGALLYSKASNLSIKIIDLTVKCQDTFESNITKLMESSSTTKSFIYIENNLRNLSIYNSSFSNCQSSLRGGVITLISSNFEDYGSTYNQNFAQQGGVFYFFNSSFFFYETKFDLNMADTGGIMLVDRKTNGLLQNVNISNSFSTSKGGIISIVFTSIDDSFSSQITIQGSNTFITNITSTSGGLFYCNSRFMSLIVQNITISKVVATTKGGVVYVQELSNLSLINLDITNTEAPTAGFIYSRSNNLNFIMKNNQISCLLNQSSQFDRVETFFYFQNSISINFDQTVIKNCFSTYQSAIIYITNTSIYIQDSQISNNVGVNGGVLRMFSSNATIQNTNFTNNTAKIGGVLFLSENSFVYLESTLFYENTATQKAGVMNIISKSYTKINGSQFVENSSGIDSSVLDILGSSFDSNISISNSLFKNNSAYRNAIRIISGIADISNCEFIDNKALDQSHNIILSYTNLTIKNTTFTKSDDKTSTNSDAVSTIYGSFISIALNVYLEIRDSSFANGSSIKGGAIHLLGDSQLKIFNTIFRNNNAYSVGGAIYGADFSTLTAQNCQFSQNSAISGTGDDLYITGDTSTINILQSKLQNINGIQSLFVEKANIIIIDSVFLGYGKSSSISIGAALQCVDCSKILVGNSSFKNLRGQAGGAIFIQDIKLILESDTTAAKINSKNSQYQIIGSSFENCEAQVGGALYLDNIQDLLVVNSSFMACSASQNTVEDASLMQQITLTTDGAGGAIYFTCNSKNTNCSLQLTKNTSFISNYAEVQGGSIYWDMIEPTLESIYFKNNTAVVYGNDVASFGEQIIQISEEDYKQQIGLTAKRMLSERDQRQRVLDSNSLILKNVLSGGTFPIIYLAIIDKYGQIVGSDTSSKSLIYVNTTYNLDQQALLYPPVNKGTNSFLTQQGVIKLENIVFDGSPGSQYQIIVRLDSLDSVKASSINTSLSLKIIVNLRECEIGEQFTVAGKCLVCQNSYSLVQQTSPGRCQTCPTDKATCVGGSQLWPNPGFWRSSNTSSNVYKCHNENACLGINNSSQSLSNQCLIGYQGILCTDCQDNFSRTASFQCSPCPNNVINSFRLGFISIGVILLLVALVATSLSGAPDKANLLSIYVKIMLNHFQLLMMVSIFNIKWSKEIQAFFVTSDDISTASTQIFSFDCFLGNYRSGNDTYRLQNIKLIIIAVLPMAIIIGCIAICYIIKIVYVQQKKKGIAIQHYIVSSIIVSLFLVHPSIVKFMFQYFRCEQIDGADRLLTDMEIICWSDSHNFFSFTLALPSIVIWIIGIPLFGLILIIKKRQQLNNALVRKQYGFLYRGYKRQFFYWDILIMYRKIIIIATAVFFKNIGVITQTLVVIVVIFMQVFHTKFYNFFSFLSMNTLIKPFKEKNLSQLESMSLLVALITFYIAIFFILNKSESWINENYEFKDSSIQYSSEAQICFYTIIIFINCSFFLVWIKFIFSQLKIKLRDKIPKLYILLCLCKNRIKYDQEIQNHERYMQNLENKEKFESILQSVQKLEESGKLLLNDEFLTNLQMHLDEQTLEKMIKESIDDSVENSNRPLTPIIPEMSQSQTRKKKKVSIIKELIAQKEQSKISQNLESLQSFKQFKKELKLTAKEAASSQSKVLNASSQNLKEIDEAVNNSEIQGPKKKQKKRRKGKVIKAIKEKSSIILPQNQIHALPVQILNGQVTEEV